MSNAFILCNLVWKFQKGHAGNREGSFKAHGLIAMIPETYFERSSEATIDNHLCNNYQMLLQSILGLTMLKSTWSVYKHHICF